MPSSLSQWLFPGQPVGRPSSRVWESHLRWEQPCITGGFEFAFIVFQTVSL